MKHLFYLLQKAAALILSAVIAAGLATIGCTSLKAGGETGGAESALCETETAALYEGSGDGGGGTYEGSAWGYRGIIRVLVSLDGGTITEITVVESREDRNVGGAAIEELTDLALMYNTTELDAVSGATESSRGFLEAVENAIMGL